MTKSFALWYIYLKNLYYQVKGVKKIDDDCSATHGGASALKEEPRSRCYAE
jgi:hypothetical protein